ncbi:MAG: glutamate-5-semialdehyde dehydrogenase [Bdellovibrionota bacterium]
MSSLTQEIEAIADMARSAAGALAQLSASDRSNILRAMASQILACKADIAAANRADVEAAAAAGQTPALVDRLTLTESRLNALVNAIREIADLRDPLGETITETTRPNGLRIFKRRVPIGVIGIIYESRPNVTADSAALCLKTGNAVILRGGREAFRSNLAIVRALQAGGASAGMPENSVQLIETPDRDAIRVLVQLEGKVDLAIPRGGEGLIRAVMESARVPVIKHYQGICHIFVDETADQDAACSIIENAKCQRPGVCNAVETVLVHERIAAEFLPKLSSALAPRKVELRGDSASRAILPGITQASEADWSTEYLDLILSLRVVPNTDAAIDHINHYGSHHSDAILTSSPRSEQQFLDRVDSAVVYVNASTRFTDGGEFGLGAEIGISTDKLHARGPMGPEELTTYKYVVYGSGQTRP